MVQHSFNTTLLGFPVSYDEELATVLLREDVKALFCNDELLSLARHFPTGRFHLHTNSRRTAYLDLSPQYGSDDRLGVARLVLCLRGETKQAHRQAHYRNGNRFDFLPGNPYLGEIGRNRSEDRTAQEFARRAWMILDKKHPDICAEKIIRHTPQPPHNRVDDGAVPPVLPARKATPGCVSDTGAGERR